MKATKLIPRSVRCMCFLCRHAPLPLDGPSYWTSLTGEPLEEELTPIGTLAHHAEDAKSDHHLQHWADEWVVEVTPATDPQGMVLIYCQHASCLCAQPLIPNPQSCYRLGLRVSIWTLQHSQGRWPCMPKRNRHVSPSTRQHLSRSAGHDQQAHRPHHKHRPVQIPPWSCGRRPIPACLLHGKHTPRLNFRCMPPPRLRTPSQDTSELADFVRRRKWLQRSQVEGDAQAPQQPLESSSSRSFVSAGDAMHVTAASAAAAHDTRRSKTTTTARTAAKAFFSMLQDAARRRGGGLMSIPWDPMSWGSVYSEHSTWLANTQAR